MFIWQTKQLQKNAMQNWNYMLTSTFLSRRCKLSQSTIYCNLIVEKTLINLFLIFLLIN